MKRGIVLALIIGLVLLLSVQVALAKGNPHQSGPAASGTTEVSVEVKGKASQDSGAETKETEPPPAAAKAKEHPSEGTKESPKPKANHAPTGLAKSKTKSNKGKTRPSESVPPKRDCPPEADDKGKPSKPSEEPVTTAGPITVPLHSAHVGANSETFGRESDCGGIEAGVVWHFVLNGLDPGTKPASLTVTFKNSGTKTAVGRPVGKGKTQHFYVGTSGHDILLSGSAVADSGCAGKLVLSHVCWQEGCGPSKPDKPDCPDKPDKPDCPDKPDKPDCPDKPDKPDCPDKPDEPYKPYTPDKPGPTPVVNPTPNSPPTENAAVAPSEDYLPYTGDPGALLIGAASWAAMIGGTFRWRARGRRW